MQSIRTQKDVDDGLRALLNIAPRLTTVAATAGPLPLRLQEPGFAGLARIIVGQQVSRSSAEAINSRLAENVVPLTPQAFLQAGEPTWRKIGLSRAKQQTLAGLSREIIENGLLLDNLSAMDADEAMKTLTSLKGIGPWTAEVYLMFCTGHPDLFPAGDLALRQAVGHALLGTGDPGEKAVREVARAWHPFRAIAARLFWAYYKEVKQGRSALPV